MKRISILILMLVVLFGTGAYAEPKPSTSVEPMPYPGDIFEVLMLKVQVEGGQDITETFLVDASSGHVWYRGSQNPGWTKVDFDTPPPPTARGWRLTQGAILGVSQETVQTPYLVHASTGKTYIMSGSRANPPYHWIELPNPVW